MKNKTIILLAIIVCIGCSTITYLSTKTTTVSEIKSLTVFGQKIDVVPTKNVYRVSMKNASIKEISGGCENPISITFKNNHESSGTISYYKNNEKEAYFYINLSDKNLSKNDDVDAYDVYVQVILDNPLVVSKNCQ